MSKNKKKGNTMKKVTILFLAFATTIAFSPFLIPPQEDVPQNNHQDQGQVFPDNVINNEDSDDPNETPVDPLNDEINSSTTDEGEEGN